MHFSFPDGNAVRINCHDSDSLLAEVRQRLTDGRGFAITTINVDHLQRLADEAEFRRAYAAHDLVCADGNPIVWLSRIAGRPVALAPGSDLVLPLAAEAAARGAGKGAVCHVTGIFRWPYAGLRIPKAVRFV